MIFAHKIIALIVLALAGAIGGTISMMPATFGENPKGKRLERIKLSKNYRDGQFQNQSPTPQIVAKSGVFGLFYKFIFERSKRSEPEKPLPTVKTNLFELDRNKDLMIWLGHSSYYIQFGGKRFLVDPVLSGHASPFSFAVKSFKGTNIYKYSDIPDIDYLIITHDHFDHLDYETVIALKPKIKRIITSLGVGSHLEYWGFSPNMFEEKDWFDETTLEGGLKLICTPSRHFSGRTFTRNQTLWSSFVLKSAEHTIYIGGDSGYDKHFEKIGSLYGPFDLALMECGQYNQNWRYIHMMPEQTVQASIDLRAKVFFPGHWGKFVLGLHDWDDPIRRVSKEAGLKGIAMTTPRIGMPYYIGSQPIADNWWKL